MIESITNDMLQRVVNIKFKNSTATAFVVHYKNTPYLITAKHVFKNIEDKTICDIEIRHSNSSWKTVSVIIYFSKSDDMDLAVLALGNKEKRIYKDDSAILTTASLILGQEAFFLGFPYNFSLEVDCSINNDFPLPLVKKATISSLPNMIDNGLFFLDGNNNPGFSGGPVCFFDYELKKYKIAGVISGFISDNIEIHSVLGNKLSLPINTGIIIAYDIKYAREILENISSM